MLVGLEYKLLVCQRSSMSEGIFLGIESYSIKRFISKQFTRNAHGLRHCGRDEGEEGKGPALARGGIHT